MNDEQAEQSFTDTQISWFDAIFILKHNPVLPTTKTLKGLLEKWSHWYVSKFWIQT